MIIGQIYQEEITITAEHIAQFAQFSGDHNPIHFDDEAAKKAGFEKRIAHGMISASLFSRIIAEKFPGPLSIYLSQTFKFHAPVYVDTALTYRLEVIEKKENQPIYTLKTECFNQESKLVISGQAIIKKV